MPLAVYKILHFLGLALTLASLGAATMHAFRVADGADEANPKKGLLGATHGVGLLLMLLGGFGMLAKLGGGMFPGWIHGKLLFWVVLGALPALINRKPKLATAFWWLVPLIVAGAAAIAIYKPGA